jgi:hypothetical protein
MTFVAMCGSELDTSISYVQCMYDFITNVRTLIYEFFSHVWLKYSNQLCSVHALHYVMSSDYFPVF